MTIVLQRQPSGLELIGNALAGIVQKKNEQAQQMKTLEAMGQVYDNLYNNTPKPAAPVAPDFSKFDLTNPANLQAAIQQQRTGIDPAQSTSNKSAAQLFSMPQSSTPGRNPYREAISAVKGGVSLSTVMPMVMQWDQEQRGKAQQTIDKEKMRNALAKMQLAKTPQEMAAIALQNDIDPKWVGAMAPEKPTWNVVSTPNGTMLLVDQNGNIRNAGNYAKPEKPDHPFRAEGGLVYNSQTGEVKYTKPTTDRTSAQQTSEFKSLAVAHNQWMKNNAMKIMGGEMSEADSPYWGKMMAHLDGGQQPASQNGMSPVMQDFVNALNGHIQTYGADAARQWITQNRDNLKAKGIDPETALTWIPH